MKTKVEINGYEIEIEEMEGRISVKAEFDGEVIEEFSIDTEEAQEGEESEGEESEGGEGIKSFGDFGEEEDFAGEEAPEGLEDEIQDDEEGDDDDDDDDDEEEENGSALESFQSFINKKK
jgi:hypothetical protein